MWEPGEGSFAYSRIFFFPLFKCLSTTVKPCPGLLQRLDCPSTVQPLSWRGIKNVHEAVSLQNACFRSSSVGAASPAFLLSPRAASPRIQTAPRAYVLPGSSQPSAASFSPALPAAWEASCSSSFLRRAERRLDIKINTHQKKNHNCAMLRVPESVVRCWLDPVMVKVSTSLSDSVIRCQP